MAEKKINNTKFFKTYEQRRENIFYGHGNLGEKNASNIESEMHTGHIRSGDPFLIFNFSLLDTINSNRNKHLEIIKKTWPK